MVGQASLIRLLAVVAVARALPLNINLGAYSPALVVGDGAIEFEGGEAGVQSVVNALQGSDVSGTGAVTAAPAVAQASVLTEPATFPVPGSTKELDPREGETAEGPKLEARDLSGFDRALKYAEVGLTSGPKVQLGTGAAGVGILVDNNAEAAARPNGE